MDKFQGQGGNFEIKNGVRVQTAKPSAPHPDGDRARDADGKPVDPPPPDPSESALPQPAPAPWAAPAVTTTERVADASTAQAPRAKRGE